MNLCRLCDWPAKALLSAGSSGQRTAIALKEGSSSSRSSPKPSKGVKNANGVVGQSQERSRRIANHFQAHIDKHELAALNPHRLKVAYSKFWQRNDGASLHWLQWFFKVLLYQLIIFIRKQMSIVWLEELCRGAPERSFAHPIRNRSGLARCVVHFHLAPHAASAFISASCYTQTMSPIHHCIPLFLPQDNSF